MATIHLEETAHQVPRHAVFALGVDRLAVIVYRKSLGNPIQKENPL